MIFKMPQLDSIIVTDQSVLTVFFFFICYLILVFGFLVAIRSKFFIRLKFYRFVKYINILYFLLSLPRVNYLVIGCKSFDLSITLKSK
jgi:hypothetical protein